MDLIQPFEGISPVIGNHEINNHMTHMGNLPAEKKVIKVVDLINRRLLNQEKKACYYIYQVENLIENINSCGLVVHFNIKEGIEKIIPHEGVDSVKAKKYAEIFLNESLQINPLLMLYEENRYISNILSNYIKYNDCIEVPQKNSIHRLWKISDEFVIELLHTEIANIKEFYIGDGHHRLSAFISSISEIQSGKENMMCVLFPYSQVKISSQAKIITDINLNKKLILKRIAKYFNVSECQGDLLFNDRFTYNVYMRNDVWLTLKPKDAILNEAIKENKTNYCLLADIFKLIFGIKKKDLHEKVKSIPSNMESIWRSLSDIDNGSDYVCIVPPPLDVKEFIGIIKAKKIIPPSSTYFEPKFMDGLISSMLATN